ncbi:MAG: substrate-binding domain-containing protein, partial [Planctomycetota bacterium]
MIRTVVWLGVIAAVTVSLIALPQLKQEPAITRVALITADNDKYWERLIEGAETAADLYDVELTVLRADGSADKQTDMLIDTEGKGFGALAVSPVDPNRQALMLRSLGRTMPLVTVDSDCILSGRICFVGADNYAAGRLSGQMIKQARPDGARVLVVMGPLAKENGERRRQGIIDELLDRSNGPGRPTEPLDEVHGEGRYVVAV